MEKKYNSGKFTSFIKKNIYYILMVACILAIGTMITIAAINGANNDPNVIVNSPDPTETTDPNQTDPNQTDPNQTDPNQTDPTITDPIVFNLPVAGATIGNDYVMDTLMFNSTLNQWQTHNGVDFLAEEGTDVLAAYDGVVKSITIDPLNGTMVTIEHNDNLSTVYCSLDSDVVLNQVVEQGDVIGTVSNTCLYELDQGPHLHFEVLLDGENVDPNEYLPTEDK